MSDGNARDTVCCNRSWGPSGVWVIGHFERKRQTTPSSLSCVWGLDLNHRHNLLSPSIITMRFFYLPALKENAAEQSKTMFFKDSNKNKESLLVPWNVLSLSGIKPHNECSWVYLDPSRKSNNPRPVALAFWVTCCSTFNSRGHASTLFQTIKCLRGRRASRYEAVNQQRNVVAHLTIQIFSKTSHTCGCSWSRI